MKRLIKWVLIGGLGLVGLIIIILLIIPFFVNVNQYKPYVEKKVSEATGRPFQIGKDLKLSLFPWAGVSFSDLKLGNPKGFGEDTFVKIESFECRIRLLPLISRQIEVQKFIVNVPQVTLIKKKDGTVNWQFTKPKTTPLESSKEKPSSVSGKPKEGIVDHGVDTAATELPIKKLEVGDFNIRQGSVIYLDEAAKTRLAVADIGLAMKDVSFDKPIQCDFSAQINKQPVALNGIIGPVGKEPGRASIPIDIDLNASDALKVNIAGKIMNAVENPQAELKMDVKPFSLKKILESLGAESAIQTADPTVLKKISLNAHFKAGQTAISVTQGKLTIDDTHMVFSMNASHFDRPNIKFDLDLDQIDLNRYLPPDSKTKVETTQSSTKHEKPASSGSARKANHYGQLRRLILDGSFNAETIVVKKTTLKDTLVSIKAKDGIFHIDPLSLKAYQGIISGKAAFNVKGKEPSSDLNMSVSNLQIAPLVQAYMEKEMIEGVTNAEIKVKLDGDDPDRIKQSLNGSGEFRISDGAIVGFDLAAMARNVKTAFGGVQPSGDRPRTDFTELLMPFTIRNGIVDTKQTRMKAPFLRVLAAGEADLIKETLDFRIEPKAVGTIKGQGDEADRSGIMVPVLVSGTFAKPTFRPDLKAIAEQQLEKQVFENEEVKKVFEKKELKPYEKPVKDLLKGLIK